MNSHDTAHKLQQVHGKGLVAVEGTVVCANLLEKRVAALAGTVVHGAGAEGDLGVQGGGGRAQRREDGAGQGERHHAARQTEQPHKHAHCC